VPVTDESFGSSREFQVRFLILSLQPQVPTFLSTLLSEIQSLHFKEGTWWIWTSSEEHISWAAFASAWKEDHNSLSVVIPQGANAEFFPNLS